MSTNTRDHDLRVEPNSDLAEWAGRTYGTVWGDKDLKKTFEVVGVVELDQTVDGQQVTTTSLKYEWEGGSPGHENVLDHRAKTKAGVYEPVSERAHALVTEFFGDEERYITVFEQTKDDDNRDAGERFITYGRDDKRQVYDDELGKFIPVAVPLAHIELPEPVGEGATAQWTQSDLGQLALLPFFPEIEGLDVVTEWGAERGLDQVAVVDMDGLIGEVEQTIATLREEADDLEQPERAGDLPDVAGQLRHRADELEAALEAFAAAEDTEDDA